MKVLTKGIITLFLFALCFTSSYAQILETAKTVAVIDKVESSVKTSVEDATDRINGVQGVAFANILNIINQIRAILNEDIDKYISELGEYERDLLDNLYKNSKEFTRAIENGTEDAENIVNTLVQHLSDSPLFGKEPGISRIKNDKVINGPCVDKKIRITLKGAKLADENNNLVVNGNTYKSTPSDTKLEFLVPSSEFLNAATTPIFKEITVNCYYQKRKWGWLWYETFEKPYKFLIHVVPDKVASVEVAYTTTETSYDSKPGLFNPPEYSRKSGKFGGSRTKTIEHTIVPNRPNYSIVINSVKIIDEYESGSCSNSQTKSTIVSATPQLVRVSQHLKTQSNPSVNCLYNIKVTWTERTPVTKSVTKKMPISPLELCSPLIFDMPDDFVSFKNCKVKMLSGKELVFTGTDVQDFIDLKVNRSQKQVVVAALLDRI